MSPAAESAGVDADGGMEESNEDEGAATQMLREDRIPA